MIESFHDKWLLPGYDVFDEDRWFDSGEEVLHFDLEGKTVAVLCCEDLWHGADAGVSGYVHDPLCKVDAELILSVSASPFVSGKAELNRTDCGKSRGKDQCHGGGVEPVRRTTNCSSMVG